MQGTWFWSLTQEDSTCQRVTKTTCHNYWAHALEPILCAKRIHCNEKACAPQLERSPHSLQLEKAGVQQRRSSTAKINTTFKNVPLKKKKEKKCASCRQCTVGSCFIRYSDNPHLFTGMFRPFIFNVGIDMMLCQSILLFIFLCPFCSSVPLCCLHLC